MLMFAWVLLTFPVRQEGVYVVQPHIKDPNPAVFETLVGSAARMKAQQDPLLMDDGRKCHIKVRASGPLPHAAMLYLTAHLGAVLRAAPGL